MTPEILADSTSTISEHRYQTNRGWALPAVGRTIYKIPLIEFAAAMKAVKDCTLHGSFGTLLWLTLNRAPRAELSF